jgi:hypothetical protein
MPRGFAVAERDPARAGQETDALLVIRVSTTLAPMAASENKTLVRRFYEEAWDQGKLDVIDERFAEDYVRHDLRSTQALPGAEG